MNPRIAAAVFALVALPVAAQVSAPRAEGPSGITPPAQKATSAKPAASKATTPKERAQLAKAQNRQGKRTPKSKQDPKKPTAT